MMWSNYLKWANMKRSHNIGKPINHLKEKKKKNSQDGTWAQMSAHFKFSIIAFWKRLCSSPWTLEDTSWPQHKNIKWTTTTTKKQTKKRERTSESPVSSRSDGEERYEEEKFLPSFLPEDSDLTVVMASSLGKLLFISKEGKWLPFFS